MKLRQEGSWVRIALFCSLCLTTPSVPWIQALALNSEPASPTTSGPLSEKQKALHVLNRLGFGPRHGDVDRVLAMGISEYIKFQLHPKSTLDSRLEERLAPLKTLKMSPTELLRAYPRRRPQIRSRDRQSTAKNSETSRSGTEMSERPRPTARGIAGPRRIILELQRAKLLRAVYSEDQLLELMTDFWMNHFNVFMAKGMTRYLTTDYELNTIRPHALGKFRDLLRATAESPAMLFYLDNWMSSDPGAARRQDRVRRNRRRNLPGFRATPKRPQRNRRGGLNENYARELMELHTLGVDGGYAQKDVTEVARCFTGWTLRRRARGSPFYFDARRHDRGEKIVLGKKIRGNRGIDDGLEVLDILARHPSTARFISTKLARRFVSDDPPAGLVDRMAKTFRRTDGEIREVLKTLFESKSFMSPAAYRAKVKRPFELVASALRATGAETNASPPLLQAIARMGEPLYLCRPPTGYPDRAEDWINTGSLLKRINFGIALASHRLRGTRINLAQLTAEEMLDILAGGGLSIKTRAAIDEEQTGWQSRPGEKRRMVVLLLSAPEFQRK